jgi:hypothetical protein
MGTVQYMSCILHPLECDNTVRATAHVGRLWLSAAGPWVQSAIRGEENCTEAGFSLTFLGFPPVNSHFTTVRYAYSYITSIDVCDSLAQVACNIFDILVMGSLSDLAFVKYNSSALMLPPPHNFEQLSCFCYSRQGVLTVLGSDSWGSQGGDCKYYILLGYDS